MGYNAGNFDVAVIGAGHAGIEAALASARLGCKTIIFTINNDAVGNCPCNPSIGGTAKGHLVREIDALGGEMGKNIDATMIQCKMLNTAKGPAVHSLRAQADKKAYQFRMKEVIENQVNLLLKQQEATEIIVKDGKITGVETNKGTIAAKYVVNAAGVYADEIAKLAGDDTFTITPRKGEYILFDKTACSSLVYGVVFPTPTKKSKGILVCTTTHGNTFIGPNANEQDSKEDKAVTTAGMNEIIASAKKLIPNLPMGAAITEFAGLRAVSSTGDFVLGPSEKVEGLYNAAGMQSPGLTAAPAVGELIANEIARVSGAAKKADFKAALPKHKAFNYMTADEKAAKIAEDNLYGRVICRCETVTEGEIVEAINSPVGARTVDGVKRRTRAGMGRCQGGFCGPRVTQILARELNISVPEVLKERTDSNMFYEKYSADGGEE